MCIPQRSPLGHKNGFSHTHTERTWCLSAETSLIDERERERGGETGETRTDGGKQQAKIIGLMMMGEEDSERRVEDRDRGANKGGEEEA